MIHEAAARGFAQAAEVYERGRPGYPPEAVEHLCGVLGVEPGRAVLDLAAGTGKLTGLLVPTGADLVAVEPVEEMRAALVRGLPEVTALAGRAEDIPLPDASVDAVVVGSAFHWFRGDAALAEIHRVVRPGGRLGLLWNVRDESARWVAELTEIMGAASWRSATLPVGCVEGGVRSDAALLAAPARGVPARPPARARSGRGARRLGQLRRGASSERPRGRPRPCSRPPRA